MYHTYFLLTWLAPSFMLQDILQQFFKKGSVEVNLLRTCLQMSLFYCTLGLQFGWVENSKLKMIFPQNFLHPSVTEKIEITSISISFSVIYRFSLEACRIPTLSLVLCDFTRLGECSDSSTVHVFNIQVFSTWKVMSFSSDNFFNIPLIICLILSVSIYLFLKLLQFR